MRQPEWDFNDGETGEDRPTKKTYGYRAALGSDKYASQETAAGVFGGGGVSPDAARPPVRPRRPMARPTNGGPPPPKPIALPKPVDAPRPIPLTEHKPIRWSNKDEPAPPRPPSYPGPNGVQGIAPDPRLAPPVPPVVPPPYPGPNGAPPDPRFAPAPPGMTPDGRPYPPPNGAPPDPRFVPGMYPSAPAMPPPGMAPNGNAPRIPTGPPQAPGMHPGAPGMPPPGMAPNGAPQMPGPPIGMPANGGSATLADQPLRSPAPAVTSIRVAPVPPDGFGKSMWFSGTRPNPPTPPPAPLPPPPMVPPPTTMRPSPDVLNTRPLRQWKAENPVVDDMPTISWLDED